MRIDERRVFMGVIDRLEEQGVGLAREGRTDEARMFRARLEGLMEVLVAFRGPYHELISRCEYALMVVNRALAGDGQA